MKKIELSKGMVALVDDTDYSLVSQFKWSFDGRYARRSEYPSNKKIYLHRFLLGVSGFYQTVDHINGDKLDCRRSNLRVATRGQNNTNTRLVRKNNSSGFRGVSKMLEVYGWNGRWKAQIQGGGEKNRFIGSFKTKEEAARAYNEAAKKLHGEFAVLNDV